MSVEVKERMKIFYFQIIGVFLMIIPMKLNAGIPSLMTVGMIGFVLFMISSILSPLDKDS